MTDTTGVYFVDGAVYAKDWIVMATSLKSMAEEQCFTRMFTFRNGAWLHFDLPGANIVSVVLPPDGAKGVYLLSQDGRVILATSDGDTVEYIPGAGTGPGRLGVVNTMREIAGSLFVCGSRGQVYRRNNDGWVHFGESIRKSSDLSKPPNLLGIDGTSLRDIFVVGQRGVIWHYDGDCWVREPAPTTEHLMSIRCFSPERIFACGRQGVLLRCGAKGWRNLSQPQIRNNFWSLEEFAGRIYLASSSGLYVYDEKEIKPLDTGVNPALDGNRLYAKDSVLWSFGTTKLGYFDGKTWTYVKHPDNPD